MRRLHTFFFASLLLLCVCTAHAQGGIRLIFWNYEPIYKEVFDDLSHFGIGYDHDLNDALSLGVDARINLSGDSWVVNYRSAFHFSDNEYASFYLGPSVGVRSVSAVTPVTLVPLGFRIGVRGGLERFYADLHAGVNYNTGGGGRAVLPESGEVMVLRTVTWCAGLEMGWGWAKKRGNY